MTHCRSRENHALRKNLRRQHKPPFSMVHLPRRCQAVHKREVYSFIPNSDGLSNHHHKRAALTLITKQNFRSFSLSQPSNPAHIQCPNVQVIQHTQQYISNLKYRIHPGKPIVMFVNHSKELGLLVKQTRWCDMESQEFENLAFVTKTLRRLGEFYYDQQNGSMLGGTMKAFGWRKGYNKEENFGMYVPIPSKVQTPAQLADLQELLSRMDRIHDIISTRFQAIAPGIFDSCAKQMSSAHMPGFQSAEYGSTSPSFASNITATWHEFFNQAHIDNDINPMTYGGFCGIFEDTGQPAKFSDGFDVKYGQFVLPGVGVTVELGELDGWTDILWASNHLYHQTVQSARPNGSPFTRFGLSVEINRAFYMGCLDALLSKNVVVGDLQARMTCISNQIQPNGGSFVICMSSSSLPCKSLISTSSYFSNIPPKHTLCSKPNSNDINSLVIHATHRPNDTVCANPTAKQPRDSNI